MPLASSEFSKAAGYGQHHSSGGVSQTSAEGRDATLTHRPGMQSGHPVSPRSRGSTRRPTRCSTAGKGRGRVPQIPRPRAAVYLGLRAGRGRPAAPLSPSERWGIFPAQDPKSTKASTSFTRPTTPRSFGATLRTLGSETPPLTPGLLPLGFPLTPDSRNSASRRYFKTSDRTLFSIFRSRPLKPSSLSPHQRLPKTHSSFESTTLPTRILTWLLQECVHNRPSVSLRAVGGLGHCLFKTVLEETTWAKLAGRTLRDPTRLAFLTNREVISPEVDR